MFKLNTITRRTLINIHLNFDTHLLNIFFYVLQALNLYFVVFFPVNYLNGPLHIALCFINIFT